MSLKRREITFLKLCNMVVKNLVDRIFNDFFCTVAKQTIF